MFTWGDGPLLPAVRAAGRRAGGLRRRQAVDVEAAAPEGRREINELHVPLGRPVRLTMTSQDVIHSFYIPAFRVKQDVLPGPLHVDVVRADQGRARTTCSAPSIAGRSTRRMIGWVDGDGAGRVSAVARARRAAGPSMADRARGCSSSTTAPAATGGSPTVHAPRLEGVYGRPVPIQQGDDVRSSRPTSATSATRSCCPSRRSWPATSR